MSVASKKVSQQQDDGPKQDMEMGVQALMHCGAARGGHAGGGGKQAAAVRVQAAVGPQAALEVVGVRGRLC
jgi:hypothetical protein